MSLYYNKSRKVATPGSEDAPDEVPTPRTRIRRHTERAAYDRETVHAILDEGLIGHAGFIAEGQPYVIPMVYARDGEQLYLHGSRLSRLVATLGEGVPVCFTVTLVDGLVLARSAFRHSVNYRSVVVLGTARAVSDKAEKRAALRAIVDHATPLRSEDVRGPSDPELKSTGVVTLDMREASAKLRTGPPSDNPKDYSIPAWAGELPLSLAAGTPRPDQRCSVPEPSYIRDYRRGHE
jgi:nitroimidazol reductase NimA-like FMN-containing flavoprotein (pyridoxamine 5'-phosphate oxidase superfamily)